MGALWWNSLLRNVLEAFGRPLRETEFVGGPDGHSSLVRQKHLLEASVVLALIFFLRVSIGN